MRTPKLSKHARGVYFVKWGGRFHYFTKDYTESHRLYLEHLDQVWLPAQKTKAGSRSGPSRKIPSCVEVAEHYLSAVYTDRSKTLMSQYRSVLAHFLRRWGSMPVDKMHPVLLNDLKVDMKTAGYSPRSINHTLKAVRRMFKWAQDMSLGVPKDLSLEGVRLVPVPPPTPTAPPISAVAAMIRRAIEVDPKLGPWLALNYLGLMRPSEVVRLAHGQGQWLAPGIFEMRSKTQGSTGDSRIVILSEEAMTDWVPKIQPQWKSWSSYSHALRDACGPGGPRALRRWAATHLRQKGVAREDIGLLLGHKQTAAIQHYVGEDWTLLRSRASLLGLRPWLQDPSAGSPIPLGPGPQGVDAPGDLVLRPPG